MGLLDDLKHKAGELGDKAKEGLEDVKDKAGDVVDDVKERFGHHDTSPLSESDDVGPVGDVPDAVAADPIDTTTVDTADVDPTETGEPVLSTPLMTGVDPFDDPLSESIGDEISGGSVAEEDLVEAVDDPDATSRS